MSPQSRNAEIRRIGRQLRLLREKAGRTVVQIADGAGLSERAVRDVEAGRTSPSLATVVRIADALGVSLDEVVAAARRSLPPADHTPADAVGDELTRRLPEPRMRARMVRASSVPPGRDGSRGALFGFLLDGSAVVALDGAEIRLRRGDGFHIRAGVPRDWRLDAPDARLLVVEADPAASPDLPDQEQP